MEGATSSQTSDRPVGVEELEDLLCRLGRQSPELDDTGRIDQITALERLKGACAGAQARLTGDYATSRHDELRARGVSETNRTRSIGAELGLARRESPARGRRHLSLAQALVAELPNTYGALQQGRITEFAAVLVARATNELSADDRRAVDARLAATLGTVSEVRLEATAKAYAYELDPHAFVRRARKSVADRRVTVRPAPDVMSNVTALLPVAEGVACYAALKKAADALRASGDQRTSQQIAADLFVERLTGRSPADGVDVEVQVVMTDRCLFSGASTSARMPGFGPVPADLARDLARRGTTRPEGDDDHFREVARAWIRRVFLAPEDDSVRAMDPRRRTFEGRLRRLVVARDQTCRTPWCSAPVRHVDHVHPVAKGGRTEKSNGQGLCEACNYTKEVPGWSSRVILLPDSTEVVETTAPSGHIYRSGAPPGLDSWEDLDPGWDSSPESRGNPPDDPMTNTRAAPPDPAADLRAAVEAWQRLIEERPEVGPAAEAEAWDEDWDARWAEDSRWAEDDTA